MECAIACSILPPPPRFVGRHHPAPASTTATLRHRKTPKACRRFGRRRSRSPQGEPARRGGRIKPWSPSSRPGRRSKNGLPTLRSGHADCKILLRILFSTMGRLTAAGAFPTTSRTSTGSTVPGNPVNLTQTRSTKARSGNPRKSNWTKVALWFSNIPDPARRVQKMQPMPKKSWQSGTESYALDK